ncbi:GGDEF domain-containing protein [Idiomarina sp.]|uniref:GGDEF domain-containing protein n=1 Tax=Idiomarina sp. TaxID=1874361 RepID=UPI003517C246
MNSLTVSTSKDLENILNHLDAVVYVSDIATYELLYMNQYAIANIAGEADFTRIKGKRCYQVLQKNQSGPCSFCTNGKLPDNGDSYVWEFKNTRNNRWYQCHDRLITWHDNRLVRLEVAADITERKEAEEALQHAQEQLKWLADTDGLTHLYNRRAFYKNAEKLRLSLPTNTLLGLVLLDIDYFKKVNDTYGHEAGDKVLEAIGFTLKTFTSETTIVARTGGEEFAIFLPIKSKKNAKAFAQQIRGAIGKIRVPYYKDVLSCTASAGMSTGYTSIQISSLMRDADRALYRAKASGRDSLCEG